MFSSWFLQFVLAWLAENEEVSVEFMHGALERDKREGVSRNTREGFSQCLFNIDSASGAATVAVDSILLFPSNTSELTVNCTGLFVCRKQTFKRGACENILYVLNAFSTNNLLNCLLCNFRVLTLVYYCLKVFAPETAAKSRCLLLKCKNVCPIIQKDRR